MQFQSQLTAINKVRGLPVSSTTTTFLTSSGVITVTPFSLKELFGTNTINLNTNGFLFTGDLYGLGVVELSSTGLLSIANKDLSGLVSIGINADGTVSRLIELAGNIQTGLSIVGSGLAILVISDYVQAAFPKITSPTHVFNVGAAATAAASGQSWSAFDVIDTLALSNYFVMYESYLLRETTIGGVSNGGPIGRVLVVKGALDLLQSTSARRPTWNESNNSVSFDSVDDFLEIGEAITNNSSFHHFMVARVPTDQDGAFIHVGGNEPNDGWALGVGQNFVTDGSPGRNLIGLYDFRTWISSSTNIGSNFGIQEIRHNASGGQIFFNGTLAASTTSTPIAPTNLTNIGSYAGRAAAHEQKGWINFTTGSLSATQISQVRRFLNSYYSLGLTL